MSIDTTKISDDEEATLAYTLTYIRFIKKSCGRSIEELLERELTEQIERYNARALKAERETEALRLENADRLRQNEELERQHEELKRQLAVMDE